MRLLSDKSHQIGKNRIVQINPRHIVKVKNVKRASIKTILRGQAALARVL